MSQISDIIQSSMDVKAQLLADESMHTRLQEAIDILTGTFSRKGKVWFCGNGGSAADAQHLAAEFSGRFYKDRPALFAEALHVNTSYLTAVANDYSFEQVYARMVEGVGYAGDVLVGLSTSGNSPNVHLAMKAAREKGMKTIGFTGAKGGAMAAESDVLLNVPSVDTPRIQESHIMLGHIICELVENQMYP